MNGLFTTRMTALLIALGALATIAGRRDRERGDQRAAVDDVPPGQPPAQRRPAGLEPADRGAQRGRSHGRMIGAGLSTRRDAAQARRPRAEG